MEPRLLHHRSSLRRAVVIVATLAVAGCGTTTHSGPPSSQRSVPVVRTQTRTVTSPPVRHFTKPHPPFAVGERVVTIVDPTRTVTYPNQAPSPRTLVTIVRYPAVGRPGREDVTDARPLLAAGPYPVVIFGHGFAETPTTYQTLLRAWARAGYVVAAPVFPLENADAPGGPNESDLENQPADMSLVITRMLTMSAAARGPFSGLINAQKIGVSGQSDGGDTALTAAYNQGFRDPRIGAAVILSGQEMPGLGGYTFPPPSPPLLATQGLADTINLPATTYAFFDAAPRPKFLLTMPGAAHLPPYEYQEPQLSVVERVTIAFLNRYLKGEAQGLSQMIAAADRPGIAQLQADP